MIDSLLSIGFKNISLKRPSNFGGRCFFIIMASGFNRNIFVVLLSTLKPVPLGFSGTMSCLVFLYKFYLFGV